MIRETSRLSVKLASMRNAFLHWKNGQQRKVSLLSMILGMLQQSSLISGAIASFLKAKKESRAKSELRSDPRKARVASRFEHLEPRAMFAAFTAGNLAVYRVGNGTATWAAGASTTTPSAAAFIDEYTTSGTLVQSIALPTAASGSNLAYSDSITATSNGQISLSGDGQSIAFAGYNAVPGTANVTGAAATAVPRVLGVVKADGTVVASTSTTDYSGNNIRSAATNDGTQFWTAGTGTNSGIRYYSPSQVGTTNTTGIQINNPISLTNTRTVQVFNGQLYYGTGSGTTGIYKTSAALPTSLGTADTAVATTGAQSPYQFVFLDMDSSGGFTNNDRLYVADDGTGKSVQRYTYNGTIWGSGSAIATSQTNLRGLTGQVVAGNAVLYATVSTDAIPTAGGGLVTYATSIVTLTDDGTAAATASWNPLATPVSFTNGAGEMNAAIKQFRGITFVPTVATGAPTVQFTTASVSKNEGNSGTTAYTYLVSRTGNTTGSSTVNWAVTGAGTNVADANDFSPSGLPSGTLTFPAGSTSQSITFNVAGDTTSEPDESFTVTLSSPGAGTSLGTPTSASGTILDDDALANLAVVANQPSGQNEGNTGATPFTFNVNRTVLTTGSTTVQWAVTGSSTNQAAAFDFVGNVLPSGSLTFNAGDTQQLITVNVAGDAFLEFDEGFTVTLSSPVGGVISGTGAASSTIINDDTTVAIAVDTASAAQAEGNSGSTPFTFTLTRAGITTGTATIDYAVSGNATATFPAVAADFVGGAFPTGTVSFAANETTKQITVNVAGNTAFGTDKGFTVTLSNGVGAGVQGAGTANATILNDDFQTLVAGDILIAGINTTNPDQLSFITLVALTPNSVIKFTDNAWSGTALTANEGVLTYVASAAGVPAGTKVIIEAGTAPSATVKTGPGTATTNGSFSLNASGENLFAYTGVDTNPNFLFGLNTNSSYLTVAGSATSTSTTFLPNGLTIGSSAVAPLAATGTVANAEYNHSGLTGTASVLQGLVGSVANWGTSTTAIALNTSNFTVNSAPVAVNDTGATTELGTTTGNVLSNDSDPDAGETATLVVEVPSTITTVNGKLTLAANGTYSYVANANQLAAGQTVTDTFTYKAKDVNGALSNTASLVITVTGENDAPVVSIPIVDASFTPANLFVSNAASSFSFSAGTFTDPDIGDVLTYSATLDNGSALPSWLSFAPQTRTFSGTPTNANIGALQIKVTATDPGSLSVTDTFQLSVVDTTVPTLGAVKVTQATWAPGYKDLVDPVLADPIVDKDFGDAVGYAIPTDTPANQLKPLPWQNLNQLVLSTSEVVKGSGSGGAFLSTDVQLQGINTANYSGAISGIVYDALAGGIVINFTSSLPTDSYTIVSTLGVVKDTSGNNLAALNFSFNVLVGDFNQSGAVNSSDFINTRNAQGSEIGDATYSFLMDINGDGAINSNDFINIRNRQGDELP